MFFCPKCSYSLDIVKVTGNSSLQIDDKQKVSSVTTAIKELIVNKINPDILEPSFTIESMKKNSKFKKLNIENKQQLLQLFNQSGGSSKVQFKCSNCAYTQGINDTTKLYQININDTKKKLKESDYLLIVNNPILARTKDYTCKNSKCHTHTDPSIKEAVFYHENNDLTVNYVCTTCHYHYHN